jgi:hypothetical protein
MTLTKRERKSQNPTEKAEKEILNLLENCSNKEDLELLSDITKARVEILAMAKRGKPPTKLVEKLRNRALQSAHEFLSKAEQKLQLSHPERAGENRIIIIQSATYFLRAKQALSAPEKNPVQFNKSDSVQIPAIVKDRFYKAFKTLYSHLIRTAYHAQRENKKTDKLLTLIEELQADNPGLHNAYRKKRTGTEGMLAVVKKNQKHKHKEF